MSFLILFYPKFIFILLFISLLNFSTIEPVPGGFNVKLIRPNSTSDAHFMDIVQTPTKSNNGEYLMAVSIGTPPVQFYGVMDTGSDLIWLQCVPCNNCYKQRAPLFDPRKSSTYIGIYCQEKECSQLPHTCSPYKNRCEYSLTYEGGSTTQGLLALDTITLDTTSGKPLALQAMIIGCGHKDIGGNINEMGIIGLGRGPLSLISQIGPSFGGRKFSYCLVPYYNLVAFSPMRFGAGSEVLGSDVVSTPLVINKRETSYYYITLKGISVENTYLPFHSSSEKGNIVMDSGTTFTFLPQQLYDEVINEVKKRVPLSSITNNPEYNGRLCYRTSTSPKGPIITVHFEGANIKLMPSKHTFAQVKNGIFCLVFASTNRDIGTYGNSMQADFLIGFDLEKNIVSFKTTDCTKH